MLNDGFLPEERPESGEQTPVDLDDDLVDGCKQSALHPGNKFVTYGLLVVNFFRKGPYVFLNLYSLTVEY